MEISSSTAALYQQDSRNQAGAIDTQTQGLKAEVPGTTGGTVTIRSVDASNSTEKAADGVTRGEEGDRASKAQGAAGQKDSAQAAEEGGKTENRNGQELTPEEALMVDELVARDMEVRTHEQAHAAAGAPYTSAPTYSFQRGPDGQSYAVGGQVNIDTSPIPGDPQATMDKMRVVAAAATAPAEPSGQDLKVASQAQAAISQASAELVQQQADEQAEVAEKAEEKQVEAEVEPGNSVQSVQVELASSAESAPQRDDDASGRTELRNPYEPTDEQSSMDRKLAGTGAVDGTEQGSVISSLV